MSNDRIQKKQQSQHSQDLQHIGSEPLVQGKTHEHAKCAQGIGQRNRMGSCEHVGEAQHANRGDHEKK